MTQILYNTFVSLFGEYSPIIVEYQTPKLDASGVWQQVTTQGTAVDFGYIFYTFFVLIIISSMMAILKGCIHGK